MTNDDADAGQRIGHRTRAQIRAIQRHAQKQAFSTKQVRMWLGCSPRTARRLAAAGRIVGVWKRIGPGRYLPTDPTDPTDPTEQ